MTKKGTHKQVLKVTANMAGVSITREIVVDLANLKESDLEILSHWSDVTVLGAIKAYVTTHAEDIEYLSGVV